MAALDTASHRIVVATSNNPKDSLPVNPRVLLARLFGDMGLLQIAPGNTAPSSKDVMWWHTDVKLLKRWDAVQANWFAATPNQVAMHLIRRAILGSVTDTAVEANDLFMFWDASLGDLKVIKRDDLMAALGALRTVATEEGIQGGGTLGANRTLKLDINGLTAKPVPVGSDKVVIWSGTNNAHRSATINQLAAAFPVSESDYAEIFFLGMM